MDEDVLVYLDSQQQLVHRLSLPTWQDLSSLSLDEACAKGYLDHADVLDSRISREDEAIAAQEAIGLEAHARSRRPLRRQSLVGRADELLRWYIRRVLAHQRPMSVKEITAGVRRAGFKSRKKDLAKIVATTLADMPDIANVGCGHFRHK